MQVGRADLTEGFERPTHEAWAAAAVKAAKGAPLESLVTRTSDGVEVQPLYAAEGAAESLALNLPEAPADGRWDVRAGVDASDAGEANCQALDELENGANSLLLTIRGAVPDLGRALQGVVIEAATVALDAGFQGPQAAEALAEAAKGSPGALLAFHLDPIGALAEAGSSPGPIEAHIAKAAEVAVRFAPVHPKATAFLASGQVVHEAGGSEAQELGFMAACALAYAKAMTAAGLEMEQAFAVITLGCAVDGDYFLSIAKVRAARAIWDRLAQACGSEQPARIEARSSRRMLAGLDAWTNLLRLTAADFAAAAGGADAVVLAPFTEPLGAPTALARRQARNIQLVLREESHLGKVADPAGGSWYVEALSRQLAEQGWAVFQAIEAQGGIVTALTSGFIAANVEGPRAAALAASAHAHPGQVGVSRFPDLAGKEPEAAPTAKAKAASDAGRLPGPDTVCPPLQPMRLSEPFEALRHRADALKPAAQIVTLGAARDATARAAFARNLLASGGIKAATAALDAYDAKTTPVAVIAGADEALEAEGVQAVRRLRDAGARLVLVTGREHAQLAQAGADGFLHAKMDVAALLACVLDRLEAQP